MAVVIFAVPDTIDVVVAVAVVVAATVIDVVITTVAAVLLFVWFSSWWRRGVKTMKSRQSGRDGRTPRGMTGPMRTRVASATPSATSG